MAVVVGARDRRQSPTSARLYLEADADGDGTYEAMIGDRVARPAGGTLAVRARVLGGKGKSVVFCTAAGSVRTVKVATDDATVATTLQAGGFVRAELRQHPRLPWSLTAVANPIYVE